jgi:hypothetical protein
MIYWLTESNPSHLVHPKLFSFKSLPRLLTLENQVGTRAVTLAGILEREIGLSSQECSQIVSIEMYIVFVSCCPSLKPHAEAETFTPLYFAAPTRSSKRLSLCEMQIVGIKSLNAVLTLEYCSTEPILDFQKSSHCPERPST